MDALDLRGLCLCSAASERCHEERLISDNRWDPLYFAHRFPLLPPICQGLFGMCMDSANLGRVV